MSCQNEGGAIKRCVELKELMGGRDNVGGQHAAGRLTVRERIDRLPAADAGRAHDDVQRRESGEISGFIVCGSAGQGGGLAEGAGVEQATISLSAAERTGGEAAEDAVIAAT